jgi:hypothetical protein
MAAADPQPTSRLSAIWQAHYMSECAPVASLRRRLDLRTLRVVAFDPASLSGSNRGKDSLLDAYKRAGDNETQRDS